MTPHREFVLSLTLHKSQGCYANFRIGFISLMVGGLLIIWGPHEILPLWEINHHHVFLDFRGVCVWGGVFWEEKFALLMDKEINEMKTLII